LEIKQLPLWQDHIEKTIKKAEKNLIIEERPTTTGRKRIHVRKRPPEAKK